MKNYTLEAASTAGAKELKNQKAAKAKRIVMASDVHLKSYQAAQDRQWSDWSGGKLPEPGRAVALRGEAKGPSRGSGAGLRSRAIGFWALSRADGPWGEMLCLRAR
jgi:hypothetical protein